METQENSIENRISLDTHETNILHLDSAHSGNSTERIPHIASVHIKKLENKIKKYKSGEPKTKNTKPQDHPSKEKEEAMNTEFQSKNLIIELFSDSYEEQNSDGTHSKFNEGTQMNNTQYINENARMFWKTSAPVIFQDKIKSSSQLRNSSTNSRPSTKPKYFNARKNSKQTAYNSLERKRTDPPLNIAYIYLNPTFEVKTNQTKKRFIMSGVKTLKKMNLHCSRQSDYSDLKPIPFREKSIKRRLILRYQNSHIHEKNASRIRMNKNLNYVNRQKQIRKLIKDVRIARENSLTDSRKIIDKEEILVEHKKISQSKSISPDRKSLKSSPENGIKKKKRVTIKNLPISYATAERSMSKLEPKVDQKNADIEEEDSGIIEDTKIVIEKKKKVKRKALNITMDVLKCKLYNIKLAKKAAKSNERKSIPKLEKKTPPNFEKTVRMNLLRDKPRITKTAESKILREKTPHSISIKAFESLNKTHSNRKSLGLEKTEPWKKSVVIDNSKVVVSRNHKNIYRSKASSENTKNFAYLGSTFMDTTNGFRKKTLREIKELSEKRIWMYGIVGEKKTALSREGRLKKG
ncbi:unnamed protein product [Moneuplotes crassus]|uniref:Uncharacterized protein n=1 Tax=Euplotes crassus TaxID=5936 RepID=A0AAD1U130_EUPCR|nr:unnamed protein product [Moneuplotes crassus]